MNWALQNTDANEYQWTSLRPGGGQVTCVSSAGSSVIELDRSQERPVPSGAQLLDSFLEEFAADPVIAPFLSDARKEMAADISDAGAPPTLRALRLRQGLSQKDLADMVGTSQAAISAYERRAQKPGEDVIRSFRDALKVDFNTLMDALANG